MADLSPQDLDLITRTVIGEAGREPDMGKAAVASVILNRMKQKNAANAAAVVLAPKQFTTWQDRPQELAAISPKSQAYQDAYNIVKNVASGDIPDPTNGALNYANVDTVRQSGNTSAMKWINGMTNVNKIGSHTFGNADGVQLASNDIEGDKAFLRSFGQTQAPSPDAASSFDAEKIF
jgi:spore germination cell wall hydrolase CwlJ-like protein